MAAGLAYVQIQPDLWNEYCQVKVARYEGKRCIKVDVYENLTMQEVEDVLEAAGIPLRDPFATA